MEKIVVVIMGQNVEKFIGMCINSVWEADKIIYCDGGSTDNTLHLVSNAFDEDDKTINGEIIENPYDQEDKTMNGKQRNFYLDYIKKNYPDYWCLAIDADEVVEDFSKIKEYIQKTLTHFLYSPKMRHFIGDLGHEDATQETHYVLHRLFKISEDLSYPEVEHPVLQSTDTDRIGCNTNHGVIWHLSYIPNMWEIKKKYDNHLAKSNMHTPEYLKSWYYQHLFGQFPKSQISLLDIPEIILNEFGIDKDELYFINRRSLESKHFLDAIHWKKYFNLDSATLFGCGMGQRVFALNEIGVDALGIERSKYAVENSMSDVKLGDVIKTEMISQLVVAYDVLEHLEYKDLDKAIENVKRNATKNILISVPFKGTPNCDNDRTHIIKESRDWWVKKFTDKGLKLIETPEHFLFKEQILIFEK